MKLLFPVAVFVIIIGMFFGVIDPMYAKIQDFKNESASYDSALTKSKELQAQRDVLNSKYNALPPESLARLDKLVPTNVDNVRLIMDINGIASKYGMSLKNIKITIADDKKNSATGVGPDRKKYNSLRIGFSVSGPYKTFLAFLGDLEKSLRIVDVTSIAFTSTDQDFYEYMIELQTYWLK